MNLKDMFKKTNTRAHYISLRHSHPEVPTGLLRKCNKCGAAIIAGCEERLLYLSEMPRIFQSARVPPDRDDRG